MYTIPDPPLFSKGTFRMWLREGGGERVRGGRGREREGRRGRESEGRRGRDSVKGYLQNVAEGGSTAQGIIR